METCKTKICLCTISVQGNETLNFMPTFETFCHMQSKIALRTSLWCHYVSYNKKVIIYNQLNFWSNWNWWWIWILWNI